MFAYTPDLNTCTKLTTRAYNDLFMHITHKTIIIILYAYVLCTIYNHVGCKQ